MATQQSACANCNITGLPVMPTLYAALPVSAAPSLPSGVGGDRVKTVVINNTPAPPAGVNGPGLNSAQYDYGLRVVRAGYIYLFYVSGSRGANYWDVYTVNADGCMKLQPPSDFAQMAVPPQEESHCSTRGHMVARTHYFVIEKPESCGTVWVAFSEHKWSKQTVENYTNNATLRSSRMQPIEPKSWIAAPANPHAAEATPANLKQVIEYRPDAELLLAPPTRNISTGPDGGYVGAEMSKQSTRYPVNPRGGQEVQLVKQMQASGIRPDGKSHPPMLLALWDAIGIAHELHGYRSEAAGRVAQYQEAERALQITALGLIDGAQKSMEAAAEQKVKDRHALATSATQSSEYGSVGLRKEALKKPEPARSHYLEAADLIDKWEPQDVPSVYTKRLNSLLRMTDGPDWKTNASNPLTKEQFYQKDLAQLKLDVSEYLAKRDPNKAAEIKKQRAEAWPKYEAKLIRQGAKSIEEFRTNYTKFLAVADALIDARTVQLVKWLESPLLIDTLQDYDKSQLPCGVAFENVVGLAIHGIGQCPSGGKKLDEWVKELNASTKTNLFWRAFALNHTQIEADVNAALNAAKTNTHAFTAQEFDKALYSLKLLKSASDLYKKAQSFYNANVKADPKSPTGSKAFDIPLEKSSMRSLDRLAITAGDKVFKVFRIDKMGDVIAEKIILHLFNVRAMIHPDESLAFIKAEVEQRAAVLRQAQIEVIQRGSRDSAEQLAKLRGQISEEAHAKLTAKANEIERQLVRQTAAKYGKENVAQVAMELEAEARANPKAPLTKLWGDFLSDIEKAEVASKGGSPTEAFKLSKKADTARLAIKDARLAVIVGLVETGNLAKLLAWDVGYSGKRNPKTAALVLASGMSIASAVADVGATVAKSVFSGDAWSYQRLKLTGGALSCGATLIGAVLDFADSYKEFDKDRALFGTLYFAKGTLGLLSIAATGFTTFTYAAPLVQRMTGGAAKGRVLTVVGEKAASIVARRILCMSLGGWITALIFGVQILILVLDDDALQKWCERSAFGTNFKNDPYPDGERQVEAFYAALHEVI